MKQEKLEEILVLVKRIGNLFNEVHDLSLQLAGAVDRRDEVAMDMIVAMRGEPIEKLQIADRALREHLDALGEDSVRIRAILNGDESQADAALERILAQQASMNIRVHRKVMELDEILNRKIARDKSIYQ